MSLGDMLVYDVRMSALLSSTGESTRTETAAEMEKADPEAFWWLAIPCHSNGRDYWVGEREYEYRTYYKTPTTNNGNNCESETQSRWRACTGQFGAWGAHDHWTGTYQHSTCSCNSDHVLELKPVGNAVMEGLPFIASDERCVAASTTA